MLKFIAFALLVGASMYGAAQTSVTPNPAEEKVPGAGQIAVSADINEDDEPVETASGQYTLRAIRQAIDGVQPTGLPAPKERWWLHVKWKRSCYPFYSEYYLEAKATTRGEYDSPEKSVESISVGSYGPLTEKKGCTNTGFCAKTIKEVSMGCKRPICMTAKAVNGLSSAGSSSLEKGC